VENVPGRSIDPQVMVREALTSRFYNRSSCSGEIILPAVPSMLDEYIKFV
jgi:hypothetical protein